MSPFERLRGAHLTRHPVVEDFVFSVLSLVVVMVAIVAITMPTDATVLVYAAPPSGSPNGGRITLYGSLVDESGAPIAGATITVTYKDGKKAASVVTAADGTFTMTFNDGPSPLPVEVRVGSTVGYTQLDVVPGYKYGVVMTFVQPSTFVFVPLPGY